MVLLPCKPIRLQKYELTQNIVLDVLLPCKPIRLQKVKSVLSCYLQNIYSALYMVPDLV